MKRVTLKSEITHPHKRLQHLAGRYLLPFLFSDFPNEEILIADSKKPYLKDETYHFSISHCGNFAAAIVSKTQRVGIDIEIFTDKVFKVKEKFLNKEERDFAEKYQNNQPLFTTLWCAKEAIFKWYSFGKVDFKNNILLQPFIFNDDGVIDTIFKKENKSISLITKFKLFENLSLAWIAV
ncbi:4'-phosphopantetheinyl transferase family protein [Arachidicoccus sp.]|uniref:4'-phosphopantetheinyl transferase family protein n=1 Tax=Arachidicoccus sp. TaxID=1872624 RepID=UPI003D1FD804